MVNITGQKILTENFTPIKEWFFFVGIKTEILDIYEEHLPN